MVNNLLANAGDIRDAASTLGPGRSPGVANGNLLVPGKVPGQRSLVGYRPWDCKESDITE